jgi:aminomethyltransferase
MNNLPPASTESFLIPQAGRGLLSLRGRDRLALIDRMSTNKLQALGPGQAAPTVLTSPIGRMIDLLIFIHQAEGALLITGEGRGGQIGQYCRRNIFYNDQVQVSDLGASHGLLGLYGTGAAGLLGAKIPAAATLPLYHHCEEGDLLILRVPPLGGESGFWLLAPQQTLGQWQSALEAAGAPVISPEAAELLRIEAGYPRAGAELTEDYIPLEAGLWEAVSFNKGCYTGQEIIARMESRGQLAKMLVKLAFEAPLPAGTSLLSDGTKVGTLTSSAAHPAGGYVGLGYVKTAQAQVGGALQSDSGEALHIIGLAGSQPGRQ